MTNFNLTKIERKELLAYLNEKLEVFYNNTKTFKVTPPLNIDKVVKQVKKNNFDTPLSSKEVIDNVIDGLEKFAVHTPHPKYFGLFNPRSNFPSILADLISAVYNSQLAAWSHAPYAVEVESLLIKEFGKKFDYQTDTIDGVFTSGGTEANLTSVLCALNHKYSDFAKSGLFGLTRRPIIYCSEEGHHSFDKAAKVVGLGYDSVRRIAVDSQLKMNVEDLNAAIQQDIAEGYQPLMIVATAGTTGSGAIDDLAALKEMANRYNIWLHADAAYGGGAVLSKNLRPFLKGIGEADSITFDAHKWMSVPMSTSMFLTRHQEILGKTFRITTEYMPKDGSDLELVDPYTHSIQWSRRFIGLKVYLALSVFGWKGYEEVIAYQTELGDYFRKRLLENDWSIKNDTPLPIICFTDNDFLDCTDFTNSISQSIINSGKSWFSIFPIHGVSTFRVCITNYSSTENDIDELIKELNMEREKYILEKSECDPTMCS